MAYALGRVHKTEHKKQWDENRFSWFLIQYIKQPAGDRTGLLNFLLIKLIPS